MKNYTIVSLADANYFDLLNELVNSILQFKESDDVDICILDAGLTDEQIKEIVDNEIKIKSKGLPKNFNEFNFSKAFQIILNFCNTELSAFFFDIRKVPGMKKKPSTSELIDWLKLLMADDIPDEIFKNRDPSKAIPPLYGALIKNEQDVQLLERLAFMARREGNTNQQ